MTDDPFDHLKKFVLTPELLAELGPPVITAAHAVAAF